MDSNSTENEIEDCFIPIAEHFILDAKKKLGSGAYSDIYLGTELETNERVAIKLEDLKCKHPQWEAEAGYLQKLQGGRKLNLTIVGIPDLLWAGSQGNYCIVIMQLLGPDLEFLFNFCNRKFSLKTVATLGQQMISIIQGVHNRGIIHKDLKPENFTIGSGEKEKKVYLIDFGQSEDFKIKGHHVKLKEGITSLSSNAVFSSTNCHQGKQQSRKDDLESIGYILVYFLKGDLPWSGLKEGLMDGNGEKMMIMKKTIKLDELCEGCPNEIKEFIKYSRSLGFKDRPDYNSLQELMKSISKREKFLFDSDYDWVIRYIELELNKINLASDAAQVKNEKINVTCDVKGVVETSVQSEKVMEEKWEPAPMEEETFSNPNVTITSTGNKLG